MMDGIIMRSTGSWYEILTEGKVYKGRLRGKFKIKGLKVTNPIAVGDVVEFEVEKGEEATAFITKIKERDNYIVRRSTHNTSEGHLIASNIDQTILVASLVFPRTSMGFIDRFLVTAEAFRIPGVIVFHKADLYDNEAQEAAETLVEIYTKLNYTCILTSLVSNAGIEELIHLLKAKKSVFSGHSGVGKSSLINRIAPGLNIKTSEVSTFANKGVHTTTFAEMFQIDKETFIIDTPGIKELGIFEIQKAELGHYFPEMRELLGECKFHNCLHVNEPKCAVIEKVKFGEIALSRYQSYLSMVEDVDSHR